MAKSGQKKAFEEETVRDDLPQKELTLSYRPDIDLSSTIQAEAYNTGAFPNSAFWNDLSSNATMMSLSCQSLETFISPIILSFLNFFTFKP